MNLFFISNKAKSNFLFALLLFSCVPVRAIDLPWGLKEYKSYEHCIDVVPKTNRHSYFAGTLCEALYSSGKKYSKETRKFYLCLRQDVMKTDGRKEARVAIFKCAKEYPPKKKELPLLIASDFFPSDEELAEVQANQQAEQSRRERLMRDLTRPTDCFIVGTTVSCY